MGRIARHLGNQQTPLRAIVKMASQPTRRTFIACGTASAAALWLAPSTAQAMDLIKLPIIDDLTNQASKLGETIDQIADALGISDFKKAHDLCRVLSQRIAGLQDLLNNSLVSIAETITPYRTDIQAARALLASASQAVDEGLSPLTGLLSEYPPESLIAHDTANGIQFNTDALSALLTCATEALPSLRSCLDSVRGIQGELHISELQDIVEPLRTNIDVYTSYLDTLDYVVPLLPNLLGLSGPRVYLVIAQTNSEIAATGGFPGAMGYIWLEDGHLTLGDFASVFTTIPRQTGWPLPITDEERILFGETISFATDTFGHNPDFPRAAEMWAQANEQANGFSIDGVIALDPVFLQTVLAAVDGQFDMSDGTHLDGSTIAETLLNTVYWNYLSNSSAQDAFFGEAASKAADTIFSQISPNNASKLLSIIAQGFEERRLNLWLAEPAEEEILRELGFDNSISGSARAEQLGIFFNDSIWSKMEWYLHATVELGSQQVEGTREIVPATVTLTNTITYEEAWAANGNAYIVGYNEDIKREDGDMGIRFFLYAPLGGEIRELSCPPTASGYAPVPGQAVHLGRQVISGQAKMLPGESLTFSFEVVLPEGHSGPLEVDLTPLGQAANVVQMDEKV